MSKVYCEYAEDDEVKKIEVRGIEGIVRSCSAKSFTRREEGDIQVHAREMEITLFDNPQTYSFTPPPHCAIEFGDRVRLYVPDAGLKDRIFVEADDSHLQGVGAIEKLNSADVVVYRESFEFLNIQDGHVRESRFTFED